MFAMFKIKYLLDHKLLFLFLFIAIYGFLCLILPPILPVIFINFFVKLPLIVNVTIPVFSCLIWIGFLRQPVGPGGEIADIMADTLEILSESLYIRLTTEIKLSNSKNYDLAEHWCYENCRKAWDSNPYVFNFFSNNDAFRFKLTWG